MLDFVPSLEELEKLIGENCFGAWIVASRIVKSHYDLDEVWNSGGKAWDYEYKFRRGGKTLCALYARENCAGLMIIFGQAERAKFEAARLQFSPSVQKLYDEAKTFHDGKWVMFPLDYSVSPLEIEQLLFLKKKPNKKLLDGAVRYSLADIKKDNNMTNDMLFTYKRKTAVDKNIFKFAFEFDLTKEITEADLADIVLFCCQRDVRMQEILTNNYLNEQSKISDILYIANKYRERLLGDNNDEKNNEQ